MKSSAYFFGVLAMVALTLGCSASLPKETGEKVQPNEVVKHYFEFWSKEDYAGMYALMSDGFKNIDPIAKSQESFEAYAKSQGIASVRLVSSKETSNDGLTATVDYTVEFTISNGKVKPFNGTYTLKNRIDDAIPGWKLIHPYGNNIDTS